MIKSQYQEFIRAYGPEDDEDGDGDEGGEDGGDAEE